MDYPTKTLKDGTEVYQINGEWYKKIDKERKALLKEYRECAKVSNYSILYGGGAYASSIPWKQSFPMMDQEVLFSKLKKAMVKKKGVRDKETGHLRGGTDSEAFCKMEQIALKSRVPTLPALGTQITTALRPKAVNSDFVTGRLNWGIQCSGSEFLAIFLTAIHWLAEEKEIPCQFIISIHDEIWFMVPEEYAPEFVVLFQIAHVFTWAYFQAACGIYELPLARAFFSGVSLDDRVRKSPYECTKTLSNQKDESDGEEITMWDLEKRGWLQD